MWISGCSGLRVPYVLAFMTVTALKFLPTIMEELGMVMLARNMRGHRLLSLGPITTAMNWMKVVRTVFINCYRRSGTLALSIQSRGFRPGAGRAAAALERPDLLEMAFAGGGFAVILLLVAVKVVYWLYLADLFYLSGLREVYEFTRLYL